MASVKNRKSKNRAVLVTYVAAHLAGLRDAGLDPSYSLRKQQFADAPPAKIVRPLRVLRARYQQALALWERGVTAFNQGKGALPEFPVVEARSYVAAQRCADAGQGDLVRFWAARAAA